VGEPHAWDGMHSRSIPGRKSSAKVFATWVQRATCARSCLLGHRSVETRAVTSLSCRLLHHACRRSTEIERSRPTGVMPPAPITEVRHCHGELRAAIHPQVRTTTSPPGDASSRCSLLVRVQIPAESHGPSRSAGHKGSSRLRLSAYRSVSGIDRFARRPVSGSNTTACAAVRRVQVLIG